VSGNVFVFGVLVLSLSTILIFDFGIVPTVWCLEKLGRRGRGWQG